MPVIRHNGFEMHGEADLDAALAAADCAVVVTDHAWYDWGAIRQQVGLIVDTRHAAPVGSRVQPGHDLHFMRFKLLATGVG